MYWMKETVKDERRTNKQRGIKKNKEEMEPLTPRIKRQVSAIFFAVLFFLEKKPAISPKEHKINRVLLLQETN